MPRTHPRPVAAGGLMAVLLLLVSSALASGRPPGAAGAVTLRVGGRPDAVVVDSHTDRIFVADDTGALTMLALAPARLLRTIVIGHDHTLAPLVLALDSTTHHLFVVDQGTPLAPSVVQMLDSRSGAPRAAVRVGHAAGAVAVAVDAAHARVVVTNTADDSVSVLDARSGALLHTTPLGLLPLALAVDTRTARVFVLGPAVPGAVVVPSWGDGAVASLLGVLDARSGALLRTIPVGSGADTLAVDARTGRVFVGNRLTGTVGVLDARDSTWLRTVVVGGQPSALAVDQRRGRVYVVTGDSGTVSVLDAARGRLLRTVQVAPHPRLGYPLPDPLAVDEGRDRVYVTMGGGLEPVGGSLVVRGQGTLTVLDARSGAVRRRLGVGVAPLALAEGSGQVVVVNRGGVVAVPTDDWLAQGARRLQVWLPWLGRIGPHRPAVVRVPGSVSVISVGR